MEIYEKNAFVVWFSETCFPHPSPCQTDGLTERYNEGRDSETENGHYFYLKIYIQVYYWVLKGNSCF